MRGTEYYLLLKIQQNTEVIRATMSLLGGLEDINHEGLSVQFSKKPSAYSSLRSNETQRI